MPNSTGIGRVLGLAGRAVRNLTAATLLALIVFALAAGVTLRLKHVGERGVQAERDLQGVVTEFHAQDALEWRVISGRVPPQEVLDELAESRARGESLIARAGQGGLSRQGQARVSQFHQRYTLAVDEELRLLVAGDVKEAEEFDEAEVDPAFEAALDALDEYAGQVSADAGRARTLSDAGVLLTVALALLLTAVMQSRRRFAEVRRQQERRSEARYRALVDQSADIVVVTDRKGLARYLSPAAGRLLSRRPDRDATGLDLVALVHPDDRGQLAAALDAAEPKHDAVLVELRLQAGQGEQSWRIFEVSVQDLCDDPAIGGMVLTGHDITVHQALQREMEHRALHDPLTGLPNRALLADRFDQALRTAQRDGAAVALLLIDLDRFKEINDALGHHLGDQLLVQIGPRFAGVLRESDTVARLGGDDFAILLPSVSGVDAAVVVAHKLQAALVRSFDIKGVELHIEASIGVVVSGEHGTDASTLMRRADIAMYVAKQRDPRVFTYDSRIDSHTPERLALLGDLRRALHNGELFLHYQPKVSLSSGVVCGAEALLRWQHPERGLIPPDAFIPLAENTGLIGPLTRHVLNLALAQARRWADQGTPLKIAVNLSARNLLEDHLDRTISELLAQHGVAAELLTLEVTESAIMTDPIRAEKLFQRLAAQGIAISIDDFGAGYTSLGQLMNLPITELKVDRSFVMAMETDSSNSLIVRSVIELGHNLGLSVVAEGVESAGVLDSLTLYTCDVAQGYYLSRPLAADAFEQWCATWPGLASRVH